MRKLIFIIGLPGSGKTYLIENEYSSPEWICYDDYRANSIENNGEFTKSRHYPFLIYELVKGNKNIIISDIAFCDNLILEDAKKNINYWKTNFSIDITIECIYFENNPDQCIKNINKNKEKRIEMVKSFKDKYCIPEGVNVKKIWK